MTRIVTKMTASVAGGVAGVAPKAVRVVQEVVQEAETTMVLEVDAVVDCLSPTHCQRPPLVGRARVG
jgi:hypothetical protein